MSNTFSLFETALERRPKKLLERKKVARHYFNGVKRLSYNGNQFSFQLEDIYTTGNGEIVSEAVISLAEELDNAENILKYLLNEIEKIREVVPSKMTPENKKNHEPDQHHDPKLGKKIKAVSFEHS